MPSRFADIIQWLQPRPQPLLGRAMAAALPTADPRARRVIALCLLQRGEPGALLELIAAAHHLDDVAEASLVRAVGELHRPLREAISGPDDQAARNALRIIDRARDPRLAYLVASPLRHDRPRRLQHAAAALLTLARQAHRDRPDRLRAADAAPVVAAVADAAVCFDRHHRGEVLEAMAWIAPRFNEALREAVTRPRSPLAARLQRMASTTPDHPWADLWLALLHAPPVARACREAVAAAADRRRLGVWMSRAHLLLHPAAARAVAGAGSGRRLVPDSGEIAHLPDEAGRLAPVWLAAVCPDADERTDAIEQLLDARSRHARLAAARMTVRLPPSPRAELLLNRLSADTEPAVARLAVRAIVRHRPPSLGELATRWLTHEDPVVRGLGRRELARVGFDRLWRNWDRLGRDARQPAAAALSKIAPDLGRRVIERLGSEAVDDRVRALAMVTDLRLAAACESNLIALTRDHIPKVAASAAAALSFATSEAATHALQDLLVHADARVRANAVESLHRQKNSLHVRRLVEIAQGDAPRPRANAIHALMDVRATDALDALAAMLHDAAPPQRVSALWVVEQLGLGHLMREVSQIAGSDPDDGVRSAASRALAQLEPAATAQPDTDRLRSSA